MRIFITGATGFIGSHLATRLASEGHALRCLARQTSDLTLLKRLNAEICFADINDRAALSRALEGVECVYHTSGAVGEWLPKEYARMINVEGTRRLLEASKEAGISRFVHVSSLAVLGMRHHHNTPADAPYRMTGDVYADTKIESEKAVREFCRRHSFPAVIVRPGFVFGAHDRRFLPRIVTLLKEGRFIFLGKGDNTMNVVYIDNLIDVLKEAGFREGIEGRIYNVTNRDKVTMREFIFAVCDILGVPKPHKSLPVPVARCAAQLMEIGGRLTRKKETPLLTKARVKVSSLNLDFDISETVKDLGYDSRISIREGLERTLKTVTQPGGA